MNNVLQTVISQYGNSPTILALIESFNAAVDPAADLDAFLTHIWQVDTADGVFLDNVWGRIVGVTRTIPTNPVTVLTDAQFLELILLKALANISRDSSYSINTLLMEWMAGRGRAYVSDLGNMEIRYMFEFALEPFEIDIITQSGIFLRPAGVGGWMVNTALPVFGFKGMTDGAVPFGQAPFMNTGNPYAVA
jgi:hypothetical protein